ncbi:MAG: serine/threonine protein kinase [Myxococcaceae bacterium]|nr:serine/threonine protein kinase [Myxococcaceae bacterium]
MQDGQPEPGDLIADKYVVERVLGRGGMGTVYSVVHQQTGKRLALKCLLPAYVHNPSVVERFIREAKAVGRVQHRHVIDVFDQGRDRDVLYIVLPLLDGKPLAELFHDEKLTLEEALVVLVRAMEGVAAVHACGVLHRDLKPGNIFVCTGVSGRLDDPRVLDFGISKLDGEVDSLLTRSGVAVGTPYYMPLEQLTGQRDLDARVDVYAMGVILYEAMAGVVPHTAENMAVLALRLMHTPPMHLALRRPDLPKGLAEVVMRALARDREQRYPSMRALIDAIVPFLPEGAGLRLAEPTGRPLRTPRDTSDPSLPDDLARATAPTKPAAASPPVDVSAVTTPASLAQGSLAPRPHAPRRRALQALGLLLLVLATLGAVRVLAPTGPRPAASEAVRTGASAASADGFLDLEAGLALAARGGAQDVPPAAPPAVVSDAGGAREGQASLPAFEPTRGRARMHGARSADASLPPARGRAAPQPLAAHDRPGVAAGLRVDASAAAPEPGPSAHEDTRAGAISPEEF